MPSVSAVRGDVGIAPYEGLSANRACTAARAKLSLRDKRALVVAIRTSVPLVGRMPLSARPKPAAHLFPA